MKKIIFLSWLIVSMLSCSNQDEQSTDGIVEEDIVSTLPNPSDTQFSKALTAFSENELTQSAAYLKDGITALKKESEHISGRSKTNVLNDIGKLETLAHNLNTGKPIEESWLRETIANAELNVAHDYLIDTDMYILEEPELVKTRNANKTFNRRLQAIKSELNTSSGDVKKEGQDLIDGAVALQQEMDALNQRMKDYSNKMKIYLDEHHPNTRVPYYEMEPVL